MARVSMVLIAKDEEANLEACFDSFWDHVDEVVLMDTGSKDKTVELAHRYAQKRKESVKLKVGRHVWTDDFAEARNAADKLASGDWIVWCDLDDRIEGADQLKRLADEAPESLGAYFFRYEYAVDEHGVCICELWRERLIRAGAKWTGRVHEALIVDGQLAKIDPTVCQWVHRKAPGEPPLRNLTILEKWVKDEPDNPRVLSYVAVERAARGLHEEAVLAYEQFLALPDQQPEMRAQGARRLSASLTALDRLDEAKAVALTMLGELPSWPDSHLTLADVALRQNQPEQALDWAGEVVRRGAPDTLLIINPTDYTVTPRGIMASAFAALGRIDEAIKTGQQALELCPGHDGLRTALAEWSGQRQKEATAQTWLSCVDMLCAHDEQAKALKLIEETCPYFIVEHPQIVAKRSELRERLLPLMDPQGYREAYASPVKPEAFTEDKDIDAMCSKLPRAEFALQGIARQTGCELIRTRHGVFKSRPGDHMARYLTMDGDELDVEKIIADHVKPGMVVADIGANIGYFTRVLQEAVGPGGEVHAVEPDPTNLRWLRENCPDAIMHPVAAMDVDAPLELHLHPDNSGDNRVFGAPGTSGTTTVMGARLEAILPPLDFAVIDCQGVDHLALEGLGLHRPKVCVVEMWPEGIGWSRATVEGVLADYKRMGYRATPIGDTTAGHWNLLLEHVSVPVDTLAVAA